MPLLRFTTKTSRFKRKRFTKCPTTRSSLVASTASSAKEYIDYKDTQMLRKYVTDRGKIKPRRVTGACTQHQRDIANAVKRAREMALMPYAVPAISGRGDRRNR